jgi:uncharacterized protein YjbI with pentapeptide repeats
VVGYDGARNVMDEEIPVERKEPNRKQSEETKQSRWGFRGMTVRDWMDLLIVPLVLVVIGLVFTMLQDARQQDLENQRARPAQEIENQRAKAERELAEQRAQDEALQAYLDQMNGLLLERDLRASEKGSEVRTLARARTLTALERLDPSRKTALMQFLVEADLVQRVDGRDPIISLRGAGLSGTSLNQADLRGANLRFANLSEADLLLANLRGANLRGANLRGTLLHDANLTKANLQGADLEEAILQRADLSYANLDSANLSGAYLGSAEGIINEELEQQADSLEGATMPNGQKYEVWLRTPKKEPGYDYHWSRH